MNPQVKQFACVHCKKQFKHKRSRDRHVKIHTGDRRFRCAHCDSSFTRSDHLKIHEKSHDANKPHQCEICNRRYSSTAALSNHIQSSHRHESDKKKKNSEIKVESDNVFPLSTNSPTNDENQNSPATFGNIDDQANLAAFWWHSTMAAMTASNSYTAPFNSHFQITNPLYAFQLLAMQNIQNQLLAYEAQQAVARYFENVQQETPHFQCWYCFDHFSTSEKLEAHIVQSHVPMQSPIRCDQCSATFTTKSQMSMHQLELHSSTMHQCFVCMESFANKGKLAEHFNEKHVQSSEPTVQGTLSGNASADVSAYQYDFAKRPSPVQSGSNSSLSHLNQRISNFTIDSLIEKT